MTKFTSLEIGGVGGVPGADPTEPNRATIDVSGNAILDGTLAVSGASTLGVISVGDASADSLNVSAMTLTGSLVWTAAVTACAISTGTSTIPTSVAGYLVMQVSGQTVGVPYFKVA